MKLSHNILFFLPILTLIIAKCDHSRSKQNNISSYKPGEPVKVGTKNFNSVFSFYSTSPESPDGSKIVYVTILTMPVRNWTEKVHGELWVCNSDLTSHKKVTALNGFTAHNGVEAQWIDNNTIAYFDDSIRVVNLDGVHLIPAIHAYSISHESLNSKILFSAFSKETKYHTIFEYDIFNRKKEEIANVSVFKSMVDNFPDHSFKEMNEWKILHLQYSPNGSKIAMRLDVGPNNEFHRHLVTMDIDGGDIKYFGPKPMHFLWFDNTSIMGHDNQIEDGLPNDKSLRRWDRNANFIETLAGSGNHGAMAPNREYFASESWYGKVPVILKYL
jgi:hypothetical protein